MNLAIPLVVAAVLAAPSDKRAEWPKADAVATARQSITELYGDRLAKAKKPCDKVSLGRELLKVAGESEDDPAAQYILLYTVRNLGVEAKDWSLTAEAIAAVVDRFKFDGPAEPAKLIEQGDVIRAATKKKPATERMTAQLQAAEYYTRAMRNSKGLQVRVADKRLAEVAEAVEGKRRRTDDLKLLIGTWEVTARDAHGTWTFFADGTLHGEPGNGNATWVVEPDRIKIIWHGDPRVWDSFRRPINPQNVVGDSHRGLGIITARKAGS